MAGLTQKNIRWFHERLLKWFKDKNKRKFSWRRTRDPYKVLVSEMMLRRTRAEQVEPVYEKFVRKYPDLDVLSNASPEAIKKELKPLGLEWRADNMILLVSEAVERYGKNIPSEKEHLLALPGVGDYVAGAVRCFAFGKREALIDSNIVRVIGRFFGLRLEGEARRRKEMISAIEVCVPLSEPRKYHYAIIDFAASICKARSPLCESCPVNSKCEYYKRHVRNS